MENAVFELQPDAFSRATALFSPATFDRAYIDGAFEGVVPARLFVDDPFVPSAALLCRTFEYYIAGSAAPSALRRFIADAPAEPGVFQDLYGYVPVDAAWADALHEDAPGRLATIGRREFKFERPALPEDLYGCYRLPVAARIMRLDRPLAQRADESLQQYIGAFWGGYDAFVSRGFGFCILVGTVLASVAYTAGASARYANIDIYTAEPYRRRGLSALTSATFVEHCLQHGLIATWDSDDANGPSLAMARRLGFDEHPAFCQISPVAGSTLQLSEGRWFGVVAERQEGVRAVWCNR